MIFSWVLFILFCTGLAVVVFRVSRREKAAVRFEREEMVRYADAFGLAPTSMDHFAGEDAGRALHVWRNTPADVWRVGIDADVPRAWSVGPRRRIAVPTSPATGDEDFDDAFHVRDGTVETHRPYLNRAVREALVDAKAELVDGRVVIRIGRPLPPLELALGRVEAARHLAALLEQTPPTVQALLGIVNDSSEPEDVRLAAIRRLVQRGSLRAGQLADGLLAARLPSLVVVTLLVVGDASTLRAVALDEAADDFVRSTAIHRLSVLDVDAELVDTVTAELAPRLAAALTQAATDSRTEPPPPEAIEALRTLTSAGVAEALELVSLSLVVDGASRQAARRALAGQPSVRST